MDEKEVNVECKVERNDAFASIHETDYIVVIRSPIVGKFVYYILS